MTNTELLCAIAELIDQKFDEGFSRGFAREFPEAFDNAFDRKFPEAFDNAFDRKFPEAFDNAFNKSIDEKLTPINDRLDNIEQTLARVALTQETAILPRLQTIESCYLSTYERYRENAERFDAMQMDIDVLKNVVSEHSIRLNQLAG